ncbi:MAG: FIST C-terminal domain-containing protein [Rhodoferax sp.]|nr:FIST C-terminal domain-containing protein [Rhodoferax sp.]
MSLFPYAHATHPQWQTAAALVLAQLRAQMASGAYAKAPSLALLYITDYFASQAKELLDHLQAELPGVTDWSGTVGVGIVANNVEYWDEPALSLMLLDLPSDQYRVFSGVAPLGIGFEAHTALVHADGNTIDLSGLIEEMAERTQAGYVFGGVSSSRGHSVQFAVAGNGNIRGHGAATGVFSGGLSGVALGEGISLVSRVTQGCMPVAKVHKITQAEGNLVHALDDQPALNVMLSDLGISEDRPREALEVVRATLVGLSRLHGLANDAVTVKRTGNFGDDVVVRHIIGLDLGSRAIVVSERMEANTELVFCRRNVQAASADLKRICAEIREELEPQELNLNPTQSADIETPSQATQSTGQRIAGAIYVSCTGRGGAHFGGPSAELQMIRRVLGDVPLIGFFAGGEIARNHLYGYTGVLTVFTGPAESAS